jgi:hypothetical protein
MNILFRKDEGHLLIVFLKYIIDLIIVGYIIMKTCNTN